MNRIAIAVCALAISGCASWFEKPAPQVVKVPVAVPCQVDVPARPAFPADALEGDESVFDIGKILWAERLARRAYTLQLETALKGCTK